MSQCSIKIVTGRSRDRETIEKINTSAHRILNQTLTIAVNIKYGVVLIARLPVWCWFVAAVTIPAKDLLKRTTERSTVPHIAQILLTVTVTVLRIRFMPTNYCNNHMWLVTDCLHFKFCVDSVDVRCVLRDKVHCNTWPINSIHYCCSHTELSREGYAVPSPRQLK